MSSTSSMCSTTGLAQVRGPRRRARRAVYRLAPCAEKVPGACGYRGNGRNWACGRIRGTVFRMKTTFDIDDDLMRELRAAAVREGVTISALAETGLRKLLASMARPKPSGKLEPLPSWKIGTDLVDVSNRDALYAAMEKK